MGAILDAFKEMDKKMLLLLVGGLGGIILIIVILSMLSKVTTKHYETYEKVETRLVEAAKKYYKDNPTFLPSNTNNSSMVTLNTLVVGEYIKPLKNYLKNGDICDATISVTKLSTDYDYVSYLNCGSDYTSIELYKTVLEDNAISTSGVGLYSMNGEKVFRGEVKNNYVSLNGKLWRIVKVDSSNNLVLISNFKTETFEWDDRYNQETDGNYGINNYNLSRIKETIEEHYNSDKLLTNSEKSKIIYTKACIGDAKSEGAENLSDDGCGELSDEELPIRLLTVAEYINASIDPNCNASGDRGCINYNYIHDLNSSFWTITKGKKNSSYVYYISPSGCAESRASIMRQIRYVITLSSKAFYSKGSGTYEDPYLIK